MTRLKRPASMMPAALLAAVTFIICVPGCGGEKETFFVSGAVLASGDVGDPLAGVTARCAGTDVTALTGADGRFLLECPVPAADDEIDGLVPAAMIWFQHPDFAPVVRTIVPTVDGHYTMAPVMIKAVVRADVDIPAGNTSVPVLLGALTLSFERDAMIDAGGTPLTGNVPFDAAGWDNSLPVEEDEASGSIVMDSLYPPWPRPVLDNSEGGPWMRPLSAGWYDLGVNAVNPEVPVLFQLFSRFADDVAGRDVRGASDANLFLMDADSTIPIRDDGAALTAINQIATEALTDGLMVWMVPVTTHACIDVTVMKGDFRATGAQVTAFETFNGELELFCDEAIGADDGTYCLNAPSGRQVRITAILDGLDGLLVENVDMLSGSNAACGTGCATTTINFPCEINEECDVGYTCEAGVCTPVEPA